MTADVDLAMSAMKFGFAALVFLCVSLTVLAGFRLAGQRLEHLAQRYVGSMDEAVTRSRALDDMGFLGRLVGRIALGARYRVTSFMLMLAALGVVAIAIATRQFALAYLGLFVVIVFPFTLARALDYVVERRREAIDRSLPDATSILASSISAGLTFQAALAAVASNLRGPLGTESRIASNEVAAGASVSEALRHMATRTESEYVGMMAAAAGVHLQRGGNVGVALRDLGMALTRILLAEGEIRAKTAGTRREAVIATLIPFATLPLGFLLEPDVFSRLFATKAGLFLLAVAGSIWIFCARGLHRVCNRKV